jgi:ADP-ribose pyrophosphatase
MNDPRHVPISTGEPKEIFRNKFINLYSVKVEFADKVKEYFVVDRGPVVATFVYQDDQLLLVQQYRHAIDDLSWEIPAGKAEEGESLELAAMRECQEESGVDCRQVSPLISYPTGVDATTGPISIFKSNEFTDTGFPENNETVSRQWFSFDDVVEMIFSGTIKHSITIVAVLAHLQRTSRRGTNSP